MFYIPEELSDDGTAQSHYESEQLEVKWPQNSSNTVYQMQMHTVPKLFIFSKKVNFMDLKLIEIGQKGTKKRTKQRPEMDQK